MLNYIIIKKKKKKLEVLVLYFILFYFFNEFFMIIGETLIKIYHLFMVKKIRCESNIYLFYVSLVHMTILMDLGIAWLFT